jgi:hypothetical protein
MLFSTLETGELITSMSLVGPGQNIDTTRSKNPFLRAMIFLLAFVLCFCARSLSNLSIARCWSRRTASPSWTKMHFTSSFPCMG